MLILLGLFYWGCSQAKGWVRYQGRTESWDEFLEYMLDYVSVEYVETCHVHVLFNFSQE